MRKKKAKLTPWDVQDYLKDIPSIANYLQAVLDEYELDPNDQFLRTAGDDIIKALNRLAKKKK